MILKCNKLTHNSTEIVASYLCAHVLTKVMEINSVLLGGGEGHTP